MTEIVDPTDLAPGQVEVLIRMRPMNTPDQITEVRFFRLQTTAHDDVSVAIEREPLPDIKSSKTYLVTKPGPQKLKLSTEPLLMMEKVEAGDLYTVRLIDVED